MSRARLARRRSPRCWRSAAAPALAHETLHEVERGKAIAVKAYFADGEVLAYTAYEVYSPADPKIPYQKGRTDRSGWLAFVPDAPGKWRVKVDRRDRPRARRRGRRRGPGGAGDRRRPRAVSSAAFVLRPLARARRHRRRLRRAVLRLPPEGDQRREARPLPPPPLAARRSPRRPRWRTTAPPRSAASASRGRAPRSTPPRRCRWAQGTLFVLLKSERASFRQRDGFTDQKSYSSFNTLALGYGVTPWLSAFVFQPYN